MTMSFPRRKLLHSLSEKPRELRDIYAPLRWARQSGFAVVPNVVPNAQGFIVAEITPAGRQALAEAEMDPTLRQAVRLLPRLASKTICRQSSGTDEAMQFGGGYVYFTEPDHRPLPPASARALIEHGYLAPQQDGLFDGIAQTYRVAEHA